MYNIYSKDFPHNWIQKHPLVRCGTSLAHYFLGANGIPHGPREGQGVNGVDPADGLVPVSAALSSSVAPRTVSPVSTPIQELIQEQGTVCVDVRHETRHRHQPQRQDEHLGHFHTDCAFSCRSIENGTWVEKFITELPCVTSLSPVHPPVRTWPCRKFFTRRGDFFTTGSI